MLSKKKSLYASLIILGMASASIYIYWTDIERFVEAGHSQPVELHDNVAEAEKKQEGLGDQLKLSRDQIQKMDLNIQAAGPGKISLTLSARGKIILCPDSLVHIIPKVSGLARETTKNIGNSVSEGEVLAVLESREMADSKAAYLAALSKEKLAQSTFKREEKLFQAKVSSDLDYLNAQNSLEEATINVQLARHRLKAFCLGNQEIDQLANEKDPDLSLYEIRSPTNGKVILRHVTKGEFLDNTSTIYEIANLDVVWADIGIYPKDVYQVKEGQKVEIINPADNSTSSSSITYVSPIIAAETITAKALAALENTNGKWRPGEFVQVNISIDNFESPLVIPRTAVQKIEGDHFVFVTNTDGFEKREVKLGKTDQENVEIVAGLNPGENYVIDKTFLLKAEWGKSSAGEED